MTFYRRSEQRRAQPTTEKLGRKDGGRHQAGAVCPSHCAQPHRRRGSASAREGQALRAAQELDPAGGGVHGGAWYDDAEDVSEAPRGHQGAYERPPSHVGCVRACACVRARVCMCSCACVCMCVWLGVWLGVCESGCMSLCVMYICVYACACILMCYVRTHACDCTCVRMLCQQPLPAKKAPLDVCVSPALSRLRFV